MQILKSQPVVEQIRLQTVEITRDLVDRGIDPQLAVILVGEDPGSLKYIELKAKRAKEVGIIVSLYHMEASARFEEIAEVIRFLAVDPDMHGIIIQLPLPESITAEQVDQLLALIPAEKDVDGLRGDWEKLGYTRSDLNSLLEPAAYFLPPMVSAVLGLLDHYRIDLNEAKVVSVGAGRLVGKPLISFFKKLGNQAESVTEDTERILEITKKADLLIAGTGQKNLITYQWVKEGAVVVDCAADVHADSVSQVASALTPAIGGVGPLTVSWLLYNTAVAAKRSAN